MIFVKNRFVIAALEKNSSWCHLNNNFSFLTCRNCFFFNMLFCFLTKFLEYAHCSKIIKVHIFWESNTIWEISTLLLSYVVPVKSKVEISQNFLAFSECMNFTNNVSHLWIPFKKYWRKPAIWTILDATFKILNLLTVLLSMPFDRLPCLSTWDMVYRN